MAALSCALLVTAHGGQDALGMIGGLLWLALLAGSLAVLVPGRRYRSCRWLAPMFAWLGAVGLAGAAFTFSRMDSAAKVHVPTGPFSGLEFGMVQTLSVYMGAMALALGIAGIVGIIICNRKPGARQAHRPGDESHKRIRNGL